MTWQRITIKSPSNSGSGVIGQVPNTGGRAFGAARLAKSNRYSMRDEAEARKLVRQHLRRRAAARKRISIGYRLCELIDPGQWAMPYDCTSDQFTLDGVERIGIKVETKSRSLYFEQSIYI